MQTIQVTTAQARKVYHAITQDALCLNHWKTVLQNFADEVLSPALSTPPRLVSAVVDACPNCNGTKTYQYDDIHWTTCDACCKHDQGWWDVTEAHGAAFIPGGDNACCKAGCGKMRRDIKDIHPAVAAAATTPLRAEVESEKSTRLMLTGQLQRQREYTQSAEARVKKLEAQVKLIQDEYLKMGELNSSKGARIDKLEAQLATARQDERQACVERIRRIYKFKLPGLTYGEIGDSIVEQVISAVLSGDPAPDSQPVSAPATISPEAKPTPLQPTPLQPIISELGNLLKKLEAFNNTQP